jgi:hypothetical protein
MDQNQERSRQSAHGGQYSRNAAVFASGT